jgi:NADH-quinone oxidoreductase subunit G
LAALAETMPLFGPVIDIAPPADFRLVGQQIPRQPIRYSGRTAMQADVDVSEPKPPQDPDTPLSFSMEGYEGQPPAPLIPRFWAPGWNSVQSLNKFQSEIAGPLRGGESGRRLIEPGQIDQLTYFADIPAAFTPRAGEWLVVPVHHIFGSEELSMVTPGVARRAPQPYLALKPDAITSLGLSEGDIVTVTLAEQTVKLPVKSMPALPDGLAGLPVSLPGDARIILPKQTDNLVIRVNVESETVA